MYRKHVNSATADQQLLSVRASAISVLTGNCLKIYR